ncbi:MAG: hypothetical protein BZY75_02110 [SAR202 cluster bacterium Io17-Chloro-G7]|nr:MAG: hypothetical protein BZY75_02110 [SAR202 cluster bacterium Io17-Chloro-G7]
MTREHVFPQWAKKTLQEHPQWNPSQSYIQGTVGGREARVRGDILEWTSGKFAPNATAGGMSEIEAKALPYVAPMIRGEQVRLDRKAQHIIATWSALKAVIARYGHFPHCQRLN